MQRPALGRLASRGKVVLLERSVLPCAAREHVFGELGLELFDFESELRTFADRVVDRFSDISVRWFGRDNVPCARDEVEDGRWSHQEMTRS